MQRYASQKKPRAFFGRLRQNTWTQKANFGGGGRSAATAFSIGSKGYIGTGRGSTLKNDFWEYDPVANAWTQKANFGGGAREGATGFSIGTKGYIGTGSDGALKNDFWEYDPATNAWTQKADFGGTVRRDATGFSIGSKGYIGTGTTWGIRKKDFWEYDPAANAWTQKADFGGTGRYAATGFSIGSKGYIGTGSDNDFRNDFWEYDLATNAWTQKASFGGTARWVATGFSIGSKGYIGTGSSAPFLFNDFWEYTPGDNSISTNVSGASFCTASSLSISFTAAGTHNTGNIFTAQLSNASGSFASPVAIGSISGTAGGTIDGSIPSNTVPGTAYRIRVVSNDPAITGSDNGKDITITTPTTFYHDADGDGFGDPNQSQSACTQPDNYVSDNTDCNDDDKNINPNTVWVLDNDKDGYYKDDPVTQCTSPGTGYVIKTTQQVGDCNDNNAGIHPGSAEVCGNGIDDNCNNKTDETGCAACKNALSSQQTNSTIAQQSLQLKNITEDKSPVVKLYPNPTRGQFVIELRLPNNINTNAKIELVNMMGQTVSAENANVSNGLLQKRISISPSLSQGIYMVKVVANNKTYLTRLIYEK